MAPPGAISAKVFPCQFCCMTYSAPVNLARHVQASHRNESRFASSSGRAAMVHTSMAAMAETVGPSLLLPSVEMSTPQAAASEVAQAAIVAPHMPSSADVYASSPVGEGVPGGAILGAPSADTVDSDAGAMETREGLDALFDEVDDEGLPNNDEQGEGRGVGVGAFTSGRTEFDAGMAGTASDLLAALPPTTAMVQHVFVSSTAARVRAYFYAMPETSRSQPVVAPHWANRPSRFTTPALRGALLFAMTAGGCGLTRREHVSYARTLCAVEQEATAGTRGPMPVSAAFASPHSFLTATRHEQNRVLAQRRWMTVDIDIGDKTYVYYYRDVLQAGLDAISGAETVSFGPTVSAERDAAAAASSGFDVAPDLERRGSLDSDMYEDESRDVRRLHGADAKVMAVQLHADEALVSWSGANYIFPVRAAFVNVVNGGGQWETVGYLEHIPKAVGKSAADKLKVSDARNDLLQRCLAVSLRGLVRASEHGVTVMVPGHGSVLLVPRVTGLVVDQVEERSILALMGNRCRFFCSPCMEDRRMSGSLLGVRAVDRDVIATLDAQLAAAEVRAIDPRASRRRALGEEHSALAFVPALGAMHGLSTGAANLYRIVSFDLLHVWKLGVLRLLAQRLPLVLHALFSASGGARLGTVQDTLDAINLRGWELGRNCKTTPAAPGYVLV